MGTLNKKAATVKTYLTKPLTYEAIQWQGENFIAIDDFLDKHKHETYPADGLLFIQGSGSKVIQVEIGCYLMKDNIGRVFILTSKDFEELLEPLEESEAGIYGIKQ